jgi:hypothetical protein
MTRIYLNDDKAGPVWAVLGAPLVGVPLMVALLALGSGTAVETAVDSDAGYAVEQVEMPEAAQEPELSALRSN